MADLAKALLRWLGAHDRVAQLVLCCADLPDPRVSRGTLVVRVACLADTDPGLPAQLLANGVGTVLIEPCDRARPVVAGWSELLADVAGFESPRRGRRPRDVLTLGQIPLPRRALLGLPSDSRLDLTLDDAARTLAAFRILAEAGRARLPGAPEDVAGAPEAVGDAGLPAVEPAGPMSPAAALAVTGCTACGVCVRACPHDALVLEHEGDTSTLTHLTESCRSELQCVTLCPVDAVSVAGRLPLAAVLEEPTRILTTVATSSCERCGARHPSDDGPLCPACRFREANAFGSALPPGVAAKLAALRRRDEDDDVQDRERD